MRRVGVVGSGYVGTVVAACFAEVGHSVVALELDERKTEALSNGILPFHEPDLEDLLRVRPGGASGCASPATWSTPSRPPT